MRTTGNRAPHPEGWSTSPEASADLWSDAWALATRINEDELETADEQTPEADRKGGGIPGAETKRCGKHIEADEGMGRFIFYVYRRGDILDKQCGGAGDMGDSNRQENNPGDAQRMGKPVDGTVLEYTDNLYPTGETGYRFSVRLCQFRLEQSSFTILVARINYTPSHD
jgi:hypothetical protein